MCVQWIANGGACTIVNGDVFTIEDANGCSIGDKGASSGLETEVGA